VAEEVRNLAQRSAEAAKNTSVLIEESQQNSESGVKVSEDVAKSLNSIRETSGKVVSVIEEIAAASNEQSKGIHEINNAVSEMDKVTQRNAANSEESASASEELSAQAQEMNSVVVQLMAIVGGATDNHSNGRINKLVAVAQPNISRPTPVQKKAGNQVRKIESADKIIPLDDDDFKDF